MIITLKYNKGLIITTNPKSISSAAAPSFAQHTNSWKPLNRSDHLNPLHHISFSFLLGFVIKWNIFCCLVIISKKITFTFKICKHCFQEMWPGLLFMWTSIIFLGYSKADTFESLHV